MARDFPKAPTIADVWRYLPEEARDEVTKKFVKWLIECLRMVEPDNVVLLSALLSYHATDLKLVVTHMLKPEFSHYADVVARILGLG